MKFGTNEGERQTIGTPEVGAPVHQVDAVATASSFGYEDGSLATATVLVGEDGVPVGRSAEWSSVVGPSLQERAACLLFIGLHER